MSNTAAELEAGSSPRKGTPGFERSLGITSFFALSDIDRDSRSHHTTEKESMSDCDRD